METCLFHSFFFLKSIARKISLEISYIYIYIGKPKLSGIVELKEPSVIYSVKYICKKIVIKRNGHNGKYQQDKLEHLGVIFNNHR